MMEVLLDPTYVPTNTDDIALFEAKQTFMYSVFEEHLQTDANSQCRRDVNNVVTNLMSIGCCSRSLALCVFRLVC
jgi:hypothetical protein